MVKQINQKLVSWASQLEERAQEQAERSARMPFITGHIALMPDAHWGMGATVGSVIPTRGAIMPAAVGVDIGCGMIAVETNLAAEDLPDNLDPLLPPMETQIPSGVGRGFDGPEHPIPEFAPSQEWTSEQKLVAKARKQMGSLGSGNHFVEVCLDERNTVWCVLHSGSRGIGNQLAKRHIDGAKGLMERYFIDLEDPDLAYLVEGTSEFDAYITDMLWAQRYAAENRERMMDALLRLLFGYIGCGSEKRRINCHHNFTEREHHHGRNVWVTRKGAIRARDGDQGVIPGSMGAASYIVHGLGHPGSFESCAHGAGRAMSRSQARKTLNADDLTERMHGRAWFADRAETLLDEHPSAYKDIDQVMADQQDLVTVEHTLRQVLNYKGT